MKVCFVLLVLMTIGQQAIAEVTPLQPLPPDLQYYFDICKQTGDLTQNTGELVFWTALQQYVSKFAHREKLSPGNAELLSRTVYEIMEPIMGNNQTRYKRQAEIRVRKEIRAMTMTERRGYFNAVNAAKNDNMRLQPNVYDVLARFHTGRNIDRGHFGPAFPSWHRIYLYIFESVLRLWYDPTVTVPYWGSVLDDAMMDPTQSVLWSNGFFGIGNGIVNRGPFASWPQLTPGRVIRRNIGGGGLISYTAVRNILRNSFNAEILTPTATNGNNLEIIHGGPHVWVGGTMRGLQTAAFDPIFFSHHAYVDHIWQIFRDQQLVNPENDYPYDPNDTRFSRFHAPDANAGFSEVGDTTLFGMQLSSLTQRVGYLNRFSEIVRYEPIPGCPCDSPYLFCQGGFCVSRTTTELAGTFYVQDLGIHSLMIPPNSTLPGSMTAAPQLPVPVNEGCPRNTYIHDVKTNYMGHNAFSTVNQWAYIPIKVISKRPPGMTRYDTYSLYDDHRPWHVHNELTSMCLQKGYNGCKKDEDVMGKIKIISYGLSYDGYAEDFVVVDNRLGVSEGNGYLAVKKPTRSTETEVIVAAFDSCGRVCKPYCTLPYCEGLNKNFNGGLSISYSHPEQFYDSYEDAILGVWKSTRSYGPTYQGKIVPVTFFCEYGANWIWDKYVPPPWTPPTVSVAPTQPQHKKQSQTYKTEKNYKQSLPRHRQRSQENTSSSPQWTPPVVRMKPTTSSYREPSQTYKSKRNYEQSLPRHRQGSQENKLPSPQWKQSGARIKPTPPQYQEQVQSYNTGQNNEQSLQRHRQGRPENKVPSHQWKQSGARIKPTPPQYQEHVQTHKTKQNYEQPLPRHRQRSQENKPPSPQWKPTPPQYQEQVQSYNTQQNYEQTLSRYPQRSPENKPVYPSWDPSVVSVKPTPPQYQEQVQTYNTGQNHEQPLPRHRQRNQENHHATPRWYQHG